MKILLEIYIEFMTRYLILSFLLISSCAFVDYERLPNLVYRAVAGAEDINIDEEFIKQQEFSFVKVKMGRQSIAIMALSTIDSNKYRWVSENGEAIITKEGRIIKTEGLPHNVDVISTNKNKEGSYSSIVFLRDPEAIVTKNILLSKINAKEATYLETFLVKNINWKGENFFKFNNNGLVIYSKQSIHPKLPQIEMYFFY